MKIIKELSVELADPLADILSYAIKSGQYPDMCKFKTITPLSFKTCFFNNHKRKTQEVVFVLC